MEYKDGGELKMYEEYLMNLNERLNFVRKFGKFYYPKRRLEMTCSLDVYQQVDKLRMTKIICGIGVSSETEETIYQMMKAGMNVARLNVTSMGFEKTKQLVYTIKNAEKRYESEFHKMVSIAIDIAAPIARIEKCIHSSGRNEVNEGEIIWLVALEEMIDNTMINVVVLNVNEFSHMVAYFIPRTRIFIDDGNVTFIVRENYGTSVRCLVEQGGILNYAAPVNFIWSQNFLYHCAESYIKTLNFIKTIPVDIVILSFMRNAESLRKVRKMLPPTVTLIMKLENYIEPTDMDEIIKESDGVLIARGRLGLDLPIEKVFVLQKKIVASCLKNMKPVMVGFQMLESMVNKPRPTRAEATDVANAVLSNVDGIVLAKETAKGKYVVPSIDVMSKICLEAENTMSNTWFCSEIREQLQLTENTSNVFYKNSSALSAVQAAINSAAKAIIVLTELGDTAFTTSALRPDCMVLVVSRNLHVVRRCSVHKNLFGVWYNEPKRNELAKELDNQLQHILTWSLKANMLKVGDVFICLTETKVGNSGTRSVRILSIPDDITKYHVASMNKLSLDLEVQAN